MNSQIGLFYYVNGEFLFHGIDVEKSLDYIGGKNDCRYRHSYYEIWNSYHRENFQVDFDYYPRGKVTYDKNADLFCITYEECIPEIEIGKLLIHYPEKNVIFNKSTHTKCHICSGSYEKDSARRRRMETEEAELLSGKFGKWFIYENHSWDDLIYFTSKQRTWTERYCESCEDFDRLIAVCESDKELDLTLRELAKTCELQPSKEYDYEEICRRFGFL